MSGEWERPTPAHPLLVGLLIDVSGSMTSSIDNRAGRTLSRLESFRDSFEELVRRAREFTTDADGSRVASVAQVFAYGFGFGNPLARFFGPGGPDVRDLLVLEKGQPSTIPLDLLADDWPRYKKHLEALAYQMAGSTPMAQGFTQLIGRLQRERDRLALTLAPVVFVLSDGVPTDAPPQRVEDLATETKKAGALLISCYVTDDDIAEPRRLYGRAQPGWPDGAKLMFEVASEVPPDSPFIAYLREFKWHVEGNARLFTQINQSEVLAEFLNVVLSPLTAGDSAGLAMTRASSVAHAGDRSSASAAEPRDRVFVSYAHEDVRWLERLQIHLKPLEREGRVDLWSDTQIEPGDDWRQRIRSALSRATVAVLFISADYLASDFIATDELPQMLAAQEGGLLVLPVIVSPSQFSSMPALSRFQAVNAPERPLVALRPHEREEILNRVANIIRTRTT